MEQVLSEIREFERWNLRRSDCQWRCGIEILGMRRSNWGHRRTLGVKQLRECCKENGIWGVGKMCRIELIQALMSLGHKKKRVRFRRKV